MLRRSVKRAQILAAIAGVGVLIAVVVVVLFVSGVVGGEEEEPTIPEIVAAVAPSTVIVNALVNGQNVGSGTGWVLDADQGLIVTNQHVVNAGGTFTVGVGQQQRRASVLAAAPCEDLAILKLENTRGLVPLAMGTQASLEQGQAVVALGYPASASLGADLTATTGVVSVVKTRFQLSGVDVPQYPNVIQTDAAINPGNSGGPLVNLDSVLVGVNSAGITLLGGRTIQGQGYAIGVDRVRLITSRLRRGESIGWTGMGIFYPSTVDDLTNLGLPTDQQGMVVTHTVPNTPAAAAFGQTAMLITAVNGQALDGTLPSYCSAVRNLQSGDTATFTVIPAQQFQAQDIAVQFK
jgi:putative serine protease PepD